MKVKMDIICPVYWVNQYFEDNIKSWIQELPVNRIILGINNPKLDMPYLKTLQEKYSLILIDQLHFKTLGACLVDLMKRVETKWFAFLHADAFITPYAFEIMKHYMKPEVGIIESERFHWTGAVSKMYSRFFIPFYSAINYYNMDRAFSGFQIFQKKAIETALKCIEDDYIYRNEDLIFQYHCCFINGFEYWKTLGMHIHQALNTQWTFSKDEAYIMQVKGLIKYTEPITRLTREVCLNVISELKKHGLLTIYQLLKICERFKKKYWKRLILKTWDVI